MLSCSLPVCVCVCVWESMCVVCVCACVCVCVCACGVCVCVCGVCVCVCAAVCCVFFPTAIALFRDRLNLVYWDGNCKHNTHHYPINTHTGCCNCPFLYVIRVLRSWNGNRCDYDAAMKWLFQHAASIKFSGFGRTHPAWASPPWSAFINTSVFLSCQYSVNSKEDGRPDSVTGDILALMWKWVLLAKNKCWGFLLGWLRQNQISYRFYETLVCGKSAAFDTKQSGMLVFSLKRYTHSSSQHDIYLKNH